MDKDETVKKEKQTEQEEQVELYIIPNMVPPEASYVSSITTPKESLSTGVLLPDNIHEQNTSDADTESQNTTKDNEKNSPWLIILFVLAAIGDVFFFIPLCVLALFGISKHPFMGYIIFRDLMRKR